MKKLILGLLLITQLGHAQQPYDKAPFTDYIQPAVFSLSMVMMHDVVNPPAATRFYSYATLAAYQILVKNNPSIPGAASFIRSYPAVTVQDSGRAYDYKVAAVYAILEAGKQLLPSGYMLTEDEKKLIDLFKKDQVPDSIIKNSVMVAEGVVKQIVAWSKGDGYGKLSTLRRYTPLKGEGYWYPTPPAYMDAVEPNWRTIRPMVIDSCTQFKPKPMTAFSKDTTSEFYKLNMEVYKLGKNPTKEEMTIAGFWDCNPFAVSTYGHMAIGFKKITPGGHWMNITGIASRKAKLDFDHTLQAHMLAANVMMDAFIACWDAKFSTNRIRPEAFINKYIDVQWKPNLQTPPFPEYTSGHSVVSSAVAVMLTYLFGDNFEYTDNSEEFWELTPRHFTSFWNAAKEAAVSRIYGGIHYRDSVDNGVDQGTRVGTYVVEKIKMAGIQPLAKN